MTNLDSSFRPELTEDEAFELGIEAWTYSFPLVLMELTRRVMTNVTAPDCITLRAPIGQFAHAARHPDASFRDVVRPNADTLYSMLWYDVGSEPLVITLPDSAGRYHVLPLMDMWTDVFATLGSHATGGRPGHFAIVGPRWCGKLPPGIRAIRSTTDVGWILGRVQTNGQSDFESVRQIQAQMKATGLSEWGRPSMPAMTGKVDPTIDMQTAPVDQAMGLQAEDFFSLASTLMARHPPHESDQVVLLRLERLGMVVGQSFSLAGVTTNVKRGLLRSVEAAKDRMLQRGMARRLHRDGWTQPSVLGVYGNEYLSRAFTAFRGLGALPPTEALYPTALSDSSGKPLDGRNCYRLHFQPNELPPVRAFWSLTMYGADQFFVANPNNRFALGDRDPLVYNADGSLDLWIQHDLPAENLKPNWLPAPAGPFSMNLRLYAPKPEALDGSWCVPAIDRLT